MYIDRHVGEQFDDRMALRRKVMKALGVKLPRRVDGAAQEVIRETLIACVTCGRAQDCRAWLGTVEAAAEAPAFCPNRERFEAMLEGSARDR